MNPSQLETWKNFLLPVWLPPAWMQLFRAKEESSRMKPDSQPNPTFSMLHAVCGITCSNNVIIIQGWASTLKQRAKDATEHSTVEPMAIYT